MNSQTVGLRVSSVIFGLFCLFHVVRLCASVGMTIGSHPIGLILSLIAIIVGGGLSVWLWKLAGPCCTETKTGAPPPKI